MPANEIRTDDFNLFLSALYIRRSENVLWVDCGRTVWDWATTTSVTQSVPLLSTRSQSTEFDSMSFLQFDFFIASNLNVTQ